MREASIDSSVKQAHNDLGPSATNTRKTNYKVNSPLQCLKIELL